jgi:hypothetical protein
LDLELLEKPEATVTRLVLFLMLFCGPALARDDGRYANSPLKEWFDHLASGKGLCCSFADEYVVDDPDWESSNGHYRVRIEDEWVDVPNSPAGQRVKEWNRKVYYALNTA